MAGTAPAFSRPQKSDAAWIEHRSEQYDPHSHEPEERTEFVGIGAVASASTAPGSGGWVASRRLQEMIPAAWWADETAFAAVQVNYAYARSRRRVL